MLGDALQGLGVTDAPPTWEQLTAGETDVLDQLETVGAEHVAVLVEILAASLPDLDPATRSAVTERLAGRLGDLDDPVTYATATERLTHAALAPRDGGGTGRLHDVLLEHLDAYARDPGGAAPGADTRARFALGALTDLICAEAAAPYRLQAALDALAGQLPAAIAAPAARAAGRLAEQHHDPLYARVIEAALAEPDATSDASLELGHAQLRAAATGIDVDARLAAARTHYLEAIAADENRPDAVAFRAAIDLLSLFAAGAGPDDLDAVAEEMHAAARELRLYSIDDAPSRTLAQIGGWLEFASRIRSAASVLELRDLLDLGGALSALLDLYADARTRMLGDGGDGIATLIRPRIEQWFADSPVSRAALEQLAAGLPEASPMADAAQRLLAVAVDDPGKARRSRCRPASPGCSTLPASRPPIPHRRPRR
ncbi:MAG: hypothetical protein Q8O56_12115 [Solirubrobacteraceae bacterium]|nr:hypothetical protein [Solirubrobacteraceae bacterium]